MVYGWNPIYIPSQSGHVDVVKYLVEHGADINRETNDGYTPLFMACYDGKLNLVKY